MVLARLLAAMAVLCLGACGNTVASLGYTPPGSVQAVAVPLIGSVSAVDQRREAPNRLATIMGGFGNPLRTLDTAKPVKDEVADAFMKGLLARGLFSSSGRPFMLALTVRKFDADVIMGRTARIDLTVSLVDGAGKSVFEQAVEDSTSDFKFFQTGVFADIADLQRMCEAVLARTVDKVLDNPAFRAALVAAGV